MATHHGGSEQPLDRDTEAHKTADAEIEHAQTSIMQPQMTLKNQKLTIPTRLTAITRELDNLYQ